MSAKANVQKKQEQKKIELLFYLASHCEHKAQHILTDSLFVTQSNETCLWEMQIHLLVIWNTRWFARTFNKLNFVTLVKYESIEKSEKFRVCFVVFSLFFFFARHWIWDDDFGVDKSYRTLCVWEKSECVVMSINDISYPNNQIHTNLFFQMVSHFFFLSPPSSYIANTHNGNSNKSQSNDKRQNEKGGECGKEKRNYHGILLVDFLGVSILFWILSIVFFISLSRHYPQRILTAECLSCQTTD